MGLHNEVLYGWKHVVLWYRAVNDRGGRRHLWSVPVFQHDKTALIENQAAHQSYYRAELIEKPFLGFSSFRETYPLPGAKRMCNTRQTVYTWSRVYDWSGSLAPAPTATPPRAWCKTCWDIYIADYQTIRENSEGFYTFANARNERIDLRQTGEYWQNNVDDR